MLAATDKSMLLNIARETVMEEIAGGASPREENWSDELKRECGAFVTLFVRGQLRGCIGFIQPLYPLWETVRVASAKAATEDYRFPRIGSEELDDLAVQISVIGESRVMRSPDDIRIGRDGVIVDFRGRRGLLLPQVAEEWRFDAVEFLEATCRKAGVPKNSWRETDAQVELFTTETIGGKFAESSTP